VKGGRSRNDELGFYFVYMLLCDDGSYYTGSTNNVALRFERHKKGYGARYTRIRRPKSVVYVQRFATRAAAIRREMQIKSLSHSEKKELVSPANDRTE